MGELSELISKLTALRDNLPSEMEGISVAVAQTHMATVVPRIKAEGIPRQQYSEKGVPAYLVEKNTYARQNAGFERMIKRKKKSGELVSWKDVREANGRQTNFVDFSFSMTTLNSLNVVSLENSGFVARAIIASTDADGQFRLEMGYKRYGDFLAPNDEDKEVIKISATAMVGNLFKKYGL